MTAAAIAAALIAAPCAIHVTPDGLSVEAAAAHAKKGGGGKGGGGKGGGNGKGNAGKGKAAKGKPAKPNVAVILRHRNGIQESVRGGRYEMRDAKGRRIINRPANAADYQRLKRD